jgi:GNAT superfamily N-acetyltransferase
VTQLAAALRKQPTTSGPAKLKISWERFGYFANELPPLFMRHWREIALHQDEIPLDPNWDRYYEYDLLGILQTLTVRSNGVLVGYVFMLVHPHLHYASTVWAQSDIFWLDPAYRSGWTGYKMLREIEAGMRRLGVKVVMVNTKLHFEASRGTIGKLFERLGYKATETIFAKFIG